MQIDNNIELDFDDVLMQQQRSNLESRAQIDIEREFLFHHSPRVWKGTPIIASNMSCLAGFDLALALAKHKMITCLHKFISIEEQTAFFLNNMDKLDYIWVSIGKNDEDVSKIRLLSKTINKQPNICIDVPNGGLESFTHYCKNVRYWFPDSIIMAGNVTSEACVQELILQGGVDIVKLFIGPGSQCTTRMMTGVGRPSFSCSVECSHAAHGLKSKERHLGLVCGDGGFRTPGDICKGFGAGLDFGMTGSLFFGVEESCGEWEYDGGEQYTYIEPGPLRDYSVFQEGGIPSVFINGGHGISTWDKSKDKQYKVPPKKKRLRVFGMSSKEAQEKHYGEYKPYRASEGKSTYVDYKGPVDGIVQEILGGIRSSCMYIGANGIKDMSKCAKFKRVTNIHD